MAKQQRAGLGQAQSPLIAKLGGRLKNACLPDVFDLAMIRSDANKNDNKTTHVIKSLHVALVPFGNR